MKRNFNTLMKCIGVVAGCATIFACTEINELEERVDSLDNRITALETQLPALNQSIDAINKIIQDGSVITSLEYIVPEDENQEPYYEFTLSNDSQTYRLVNGSVGNIPTIGINENGNWTLTTEDGNTTEILVNGKPASAKAIVPEFEIDSEGYWTISTNDGENFTRVLNSEGQPVLATGTEGSDIFDNVEYVEAEGVLRITMAGSDTPIEVRVISAEEFSCIIMYNGAEVDYDTPIEFGLGNVMNFNVSMTGVVTSIISKPEGWSAVLGDPANGTAVLTVTAPATMTPVTRISASTENDITIHAINEEGLSIFAKMQVKLLPGEKPSISVSAVDAYSYTSVSFNLEDAQDMTSYKYLLYNADSPAPTEASFANATEVTSENPVTPLELNKTSDGTTVLYNESYTLYVMPVNTTTEGYVINGDIEQATASTLTADTYSDIYDANLTINIAGIQVNKATYGNAETITESNATLNITTGETTGVAVYFIDTDAELTFSGTYGTLILIGNSLDQKVRVTQNGRININNADVSNEDLICHNITFDGSAITQSPFSFANNGEFGNIVFSDCDIIWNSQYTFLYNNTVTVPMESVIFDGCRFNYNDRNHTTNNQIISTGTNAQTISRFVFNNNIVYASDARDVRILSSSSGTINDISITNNSFINAGITIGGGNPQFFYIGTGGNIEFSDNLFWVGNHTFRASYVFRLANSLTGTSTFGDNILYKEATSGFSLFFTGNNSATVDGASLTTITDDPFAGGTFKLETGTFIPNSTYSSYGAQQ